MTTVREARRDDLEAVVEVHLASFSGFFLSTLGPRFLREFYAALIDHPGGVLLVGVNDGDVVGFVGGAREQVGFYADLLAGRKWRFVWAALPAVMRRPSVGRRVVRGRQRAEGVDTLAGPCLMTIGVRPQREGGGVGRALVAGFEAELRSLGESTYCLTTDADNNDRTNDFYRRLGMHKRRVLETPEGRRLNEFTKTLDPNLEGYR